VGLEGDDGSFYDVWSEGCLEDSWNLEFVHGFAFEVENFGCNLAHSVFLFFILEVVLTRFQLFSVAPLGRVWVVVLAL